MKKVLMNFMYQSSFQIMKIIIPIVTIPIVSKALGPYGIGEFNYINSISQYFILLSTLGLNLYGNREISINRDNKIQMSKRFWEIFLIQLFTSIISLILYFLLIVYLVKDNYLLYIIQGLVILSSIADISWFFMGIEDFKKTSMTNLIINIFGFIAIITLIKEPSDLWLYILIQALTVFLSQSIVWVFLFKKILIVKVKMSDLKKHIKPSIVYFIPKISIVLYTNINKTLLGILSSKSDVGYYTNAVVLNTVLVTVLTTLDLVLMPKMSHLFSKNRENEMLQVLKKSIHIQLFFSVALVFGMWTVYDKLSLWFFGENFSGIENYIPWLSILIAVIPLGMAVSRQYLLPSSQIKSYNISVILGALVSVVINVLLIPIVGIYGAIIATITSEIFVTLTRIYYLIKDTAFKFDMYQIINNVFSGLVMLITTRYLTKTFPATIFTTLAQGGIGVIIYMSITILLKSNPLYEIYKQKRGS